MRTGATTGGWNRRGGGYREGGNLGGSRYRVRE